MLQLGLLDWIGQLLKSFLEKLGSYIWKFFTEFFEWVFDKFVGLIQELITSYGFNIDLSWASTAFGYVNYFFPLNETFALASGLLVFWLGVLSIKMILKLIPTVY